MLKTEVPLIRMTGSSIPKDRGGRDAKRKVVSDLHLPCADKDRMHMGISLSTLVCRWENLLASLQAGTDQVLPQ